MKQKLIKWSKPLLYACMGWTIYLSNGFVSLILLGEYPYPTMDDQTTSSI